MNGQKASGWSSGSPALSAAFPLHLYMQQWRTKAERVPFLQGRDYSGGSAPDFNGLPN